MHNQFTSSRLFSRISVIWWLLFAGFALPVLPAQSVLLSGRITSVSGNPLEDVSVEGTDGTFSSFALTDANGEYTLQLPAGGTYTVTPTNDSNPMDGVSSFDLVLIAQHYLGTLPFTSPYQIIAADANRDGSIASLDTTEFRKLVLGIYSELPNNTSWRFVRSNYIFPNPQNPFVPPFPEVATVGPVSNDVAGINFIGIKIGDVNGTCSQCGGANPYTSAFSGRLQFDQNGNCQGDPGEPPLEGWMLTAQNPNETFHAFSLSDGSYYLPAPAGTYDLILTPPNGLWSPCTDTVSGLLLADQHIDTVDFTAAALADCPHLEVDLSTPFLRRCFNNIYTVHYCNNGTVLAENASITVEFDPFLAVQSSTLPWTSVNGNTYTFDLGNIPPGQCGDFRVNVLLSCDAAPGQTHCSSAQAQPDTLCLPVNPKWSGANLEVSGQCAGNEVNFTIKNTGAPMTAAVNFVVIEDIMIQMVGGPIQLGSGATQVVTLPANGSTWRLELDQAAYHPWSQHPNAFVEGCGTGAGGSFSKGYVTLFPFGSERSSGDRDCRENISSFDPNDKQGFPRGVDNEHFVPKDQAITYQIRFQNTGTDTAFNIIVLDTLSDLLDPLTFRPGAASHSYTYSMKDANVLQFVFQNILLPDSNINEAASHGYIQFTAQPKPGLPSPSRIENQAAIYFDFNEPVLTNRTWHTVGEKYLNVSTTVFRPGLTVDVFPNPASVSATLLLKTNQSMQGRFRLYDLRGRMVREQPFQTQSIVVPTAGLTPGLYLFRLESEGATIAAGKLAVQGGE